MKSVLAFAAIAAALAAPVVAAGDVAPFGFRVGGVTFALPPPTGYCLPQGTQIDVAQLVAAADTNSTTDLTLFRCDVVVVPGANDYTLIKTPKSMLVTTVTRADVFASLGKEFDDPALGAAQIKSKDREAAKDLENVIATPVTMDSAIRPRGRDSSCAYIGGTVSMGTATTHYVQALGSCITVVGGRLLTVTRYGKKTEPADIVQLLREARAVAESITVTP